jgi:hypothetical protein
MELIRQHQNAHILSDWRIPVKFSEVDFHHSIVGSRDVVGESDGEIFSDKPRIFSYRDWEYLQRNLGQEYLP